MEQKPAIKAARLVDLVESEDIEHPSWIGPDILPKSCKLIFGGGAGIGKSMLMLELARGLAVGKAPFDYNKFVVDAPTKSLIIEHELKPYGLKKRASQMYKTKEERDLVREQIYFVSGETDLNFSDMDGYKKLVDIVGEVQPAVLFLDPIGKMHYGDENDAATMAKLFHKLDKLVVMGKSWGMSIIFSHHFGKPPKGRDAEGYDPLDIYNFRGSSKFKDDPDTRVSVNQLKFMATPHKAWSIQTRWLTRQGEGPPDLVMTVNEKNDLRVRFVKEAGRADGALPPLPPIRPVEPKAPVLPPPAGGRGISVFPSV